MQFSAITSRITEKRVYLTIILGLLLYVFLQDKCKGDEVNEWKRKWERAQGMVDEGHSTWGKVVTTLNTSSELTKAMKASLDSLDFNGFKDHVEETLRAIKKSGERPLFTTAVLATFQNKLDSALLFNAEPRTGADWQFKLLYPDSVNPFIEYNGLIFAHNRRVAGNWKFNRIPLSVIITQAKDKTWKAHVTGPDYFIVDSMQVHALPPEKMAADHKFKFFAGLGAGYSFESRSLVFALNAGIRIRKMRLMVQGDTKSNVSLHVLRDFR